MKLVTIAAYTDLPEAYVARSKLEGANIFCRIADEHLVGMSWMYSNAVNGVKLQVFENDAQEALAILSAEPIPAPAMPEVSSSPPLVCPQCGGTEIESKNAARAFMALSCLIGMPLPFSFKRLRCQACGHAWKEQG